MDEPENSETPVAAGQIHDRLLTRPLPRMTTAWREAFFKPSDDPFAEIVRGIQFEAYGREAMETARRIGRAGWTFPMDATPGEAADLARQAEAEDIDVVFSRYYDAGGYDALKESLRSKRSIDRWRGLIEQAFIGYEAGLTLIVVPAMMTVVEGVLAQAGEQWESIRARDIAAEIRQKAMPQSITLAVAISVEEFINVLFASHPFSGDRPALLNRHWILHGRDETAWNKADCLRLFQAVDTIRD